jgi:hypothetical protein
MRAWPQVSPQITRQTLSTHGRRTSPSAGAAAAASVSPAANGFPSATSPCDVCLHQVSVCSAHTRDTRIDTHRAGRRSVSTAEKVGLTPECLLLLAQKVLWRQGRAYTR